MKPRRPFSNWLEVHFVVRQWHFGGPLFRPTSAAFLRFPSTWKPWSFEWCKRNGKKLPESTNICRAACSADWRDSTPPDRAVDFRAKSRERSADWPCLGFLPSPPVCATLLTSRKKVNSIIRERVHVHVRLHLQNTRQSCVSRFTLETRNGNCRRWRIRPSCNSKRPASCCTLFKPKTPKKRTVNTKKLDDSRTLLPCGGWRATDQANQAALGHNQETYWTIPTVPNTAASQLTSRPAKSTPHGTHVHRVATNLLLFFSEAALFSIQIEFIQKDVRIRVAFSLHIFHSTFEWTFVKAFQSSWCAAMKCSSFHRLECSPFRAFSDFLRIFKAGAV